MKTTLAVLQSAFSDSLEENIRTVETLCEAASQAGAQIVVPPELFGGLYFCKEQREDLFKNAETLSNSKLVCHFQKVCKRLNIIMPVSFFERNGQACFNSVAMIDNRGNVMGVYQKTHIPDGPGYQEKFYFKPGTTGFQIWKTPYGTVGVGICWDQWFPECSRAMVLKGADILLYPTAIGSEPHMPELNTKEPWRRVMQGQAIANSCIVAAANRVGKESNIHFYGSSFICDQRGDLVAEMNNHEHGFRSIKIDLVKLQNDRDGFGFFRDRRPNHYQTLVERN